MAKKNIEATVEINDFVFPNTGIGFYNEKKVYVKNAITGQKVKLRINRKRKKYIGKVLEILKTSNKEIKPKCPDFLNCGGCTFQNIPYYYELEVKKNMVEKIFASKNILIEQKLEIVESPLLEGYRNKMEFSFGDTEKNGELTLGMRKLDSYYEVVTSKHCNLIDEDFRKILLTTLDFFNNSNETFHHKKTKEGSLRHLVVRKGHFTKELFINLVTTSNLNTDLENWVDKLNKLTLNSKISGIAHSINNSVADIVVAEEFNLLCGKDYFFEKLLGFNFKISPFSFFQTNSSGAEKLYSTIKEFCGNSNDKIIFDLYCGTGTISQILSVNAKKVIGIELVEEAIEMANENAKLNEITNCEFIAGDVLKKVDELLIHPDIIIVDPPRSGIHKKALEKTIAFNAPTIIYVSCKPTSLVDDLQILLDSGYEIKNIRCLDMFPRTYHVETVVLMSKIKSNK